MDSEKPLFGHDTEMGEVMTVEAAAILFGVTSDEMQAEFDRQRAEQGGGTNFQMVMPKPWLRQGRRRIREASAALGTDDLVTIAHYLKIERDGGAAFRKAP